MPAPVKPLPPPPALFVAVIAPLLHFELPKPLEVMDFVIRSAHVEPLAAVLHRQRGGTLPEIALDSAFHLGIQDDVPRTLSIQVACVLFVSSSLYRS